MPIPISSNPNRHLFTLSSKIFPKGLPQGIEGGENAPDANHFLPFLPPSNVGNELRPASPFHTILRFRHCDAPFLLDTALLSAFVSIRCIVYSKPQTRHISFSSTAAACAVVAIFDQLYVYPSENLWYVCWAGIWEKPGYHTVGFESMMILLNNAASRMKLLAFTLR